MRGSLLCIIFLLFANNLISQEFSAKDFLSASSLSSKKFESYLGKKKFTPSGSRMKNDTVIRIYNLKEKKKKKKKDTVVIKRSIEAFQTKNHVSFTYFTSLRKEYIEALRTLKETGFFCGNENDSAAMLFQKKNLSVHANLIKEPSGDTIYSLLFSQHELPLPEKIEFAEDLLEFYSHEYLVGVFGDKNAIKDLYYFSEKEFAKCTVLFPKTSRQAVFIWEDQVNLCKPAYLIVGGNMNTESSVNYDGLIGENVWTSKEGVYPGMSIHSLVRLNGESFKFYGKNSNLPYTVLPDNSGTVNFKRNKVMLGCLNPSGSRLLNNSTVNAGEILSDNLGMYVLMIMVFPTQKHN